MCQEPFERAKTAFADWQARGGESGFRVLVVDEDIMWDGFRVWG